MHALICECIQRVDLSLIELSRNASKSRNTSFFLPRYLAGWWGIIDAKSLLRHPPFTSATLPGAWGSSGSGLTVTSNNFMWPHALSELIRARNWSFVPIGTAWSTACVPTPPLPGSDEFPTASRYKATSYSKRPGVSSTTPETRAPCGLSKSSRIHFDCGTKKKDWEASGSNCVLNTHKVPANPAALCLSRVGSGGLHMRINSWSANITTPGNAGNQILRWINSCNFGKKKKTRRWGNNLKNLATL